MCIVKKEVLSMKVKTFDFFKIGLGACLGWHAGLLIITAMGRGTQKPAYEGPVTEEENKKTEE